MKKKPNGYRYFLSPDRMPFRNLHPGSTDNQFFSSGPGLFPEGKPCAGLPSGYQRFTAHIRKFADGYETYVMTSFFFVTGGSHCAPQPSVSLEILRKTVFFLAKRLPDGGFTAPSQERLNRTVNAMTDFAARHSDLPQYALIAPNAVNILSDKLPALAAATDQNPYLDATAAALEKAGVTFVDVRDTLSQHKDDGIYYHTDHHWTTQGAYFAYMQLAKVLGIDSSSISYDKLPVSMSFQGTLSAKSGFVLLRKKKWMSFFQEMTRFLPLL